jgi:site-specific recombinase XerD
VPSNEIRHPLRLRLVRYQNCVDKLSHGLFARQAVKVLERVDDRRLAVPRGDVDILTSERGAPFTTAGFARMVERAGEAAGFKFKAHPHMLRHACGFALANKGHDTRALQAYLGHRNIQHTVRYTELSPDRFKNFWR